MSAATTPERAIDALLAGLPRRALLALAVRALDAAARRPAVLNVTVDTWRLARQVERLARKGSEP